MSEGQRKTVPDKTPEQQGQPAERRESDERLRRIRAQRDKREREHKAKVHQKK